MTSPSAQDHRRKPWAWPEYSRGQFPVRLRDGIWVVHNAADVTGLAPPPTTWAGEDTGHG